MFGTNATPSFKREPITLEQIEVILGKHLNGKSKAFLEFLRKLDWDKTAVFQEERSNSSSFTSGFRVVHFIDKVEEKWHHIWGQTWFGLTAVMS